MWDTIRIIGMPILFGFLLWQAVRDGGVTWFGKSFLRTTGPVGYWLSVGLFAAFLTYGLLRFYFWALPVPLMASDIAGCIPNDDDGTVCTITIPPLETAR